MLPFSLRQFAALMLLLVLIASHYGAYRTGRALEAVDRAKDHIVALESVIQTEREYRAREAQLRKEVDDVNVQSQALKKRSAAAAVSAAGELRLLQEALAATSGASCNPAATGRVDGASEGGLLLECAGKYQGVAAEADTLANRVTDLQGYVRVVLKSCGKP